jgi:hypothetical protein
MTDAERLAHWLANTVQQGDCLLWQGATQQGGYGRVNWNDVTMTAHRAIYILSHPTPLPRGLQVDHLCRVRLCINPLHLEAVSQAENIRRIPRTPTLVCVTAGCDRPAAKARRHCWSHAKRRAPRQLTVWSW